MMPGPDQVIACPNCKSLAKYGTLLSGNNFGARLWTDGKQVAPMLPHPPAVVKCRKCKECYWLSEASEIGTLDPWSTEGSDPDWMSAHVVEAPEENDCYQAIAAGLAVKPGDERNLRIFTWWRRNDAFRDSQDAKAGSIENASDECRKNLSALVNLLDDGAQNDRIMKAEALRELGDFEASQEILGTLSAAPAAVVQQLRDFCEAEDTCVREFHFEKDPPRQKTKRKRAKASERRKGKK